MRGLIYSGLALLIVGMTILPARRSQLAPSGRSGAQAGLELVEAGQRRLERNDDVAEVESQPLQLLLEGLTPVPPKVPTPSTLKLTTPSPLLSINASSVEEPL